jgi:hypothetical protein
MIIKGELFLRGKGEGVGDEYCRSILYMYEDNIKKPTKVC